MDDTDPSSIRPVLLRPLTLGLIGLVVVGGSAVLAVRAYRQDVPAFVPAAATASVAAPASLVPGAPVGAAAAAAALPSPPPAADAAATTPQFDVVRVNPQGDAVIAGRASPGAEVTIRDGDTELGRVQADRRGEFVFVPTAPLPPGARQLALVEQGSDGARLAGDAPVVLVVPDRGAAAAADALPPLALLTPPAAPPRLLQAPPAEPAAGPTAGSPQAGGKAALDVVDYDEHGELRFAGRAPPGGSVQVYVDDKPVGSAQAGPAGRWELTPGAAVPQGDHRIRVDQLGAAGRVVGRVELPFRRDSVPADAVAGGRVVVQPGHNLWRLARAAYGLGNRYTVIYQANRDQIRDPAKIYPGQIFVLPAAVASGPTPSASSTSR